MAQALIVGGAVARVFRVADQMYGWEFARDHFGAVVGAVVIDDDGLHRDALAGQDGLKAAAQQFAGIPIDDDDSNIFHDRILTWGTGVINRRLADGLFVPPLMGASGFRGEGVFSQS